MYVPIMYVARMLKKKIMINLSISYKGGSEAFLRGGRLWTLMSDI